MSVCVACLVIFHRCMILHDPTQALFRCRCRKGWFIALFFNMFSPPTSLRVCGGERGLSVCLCLPFIMNNLLTIRGCCCAILLSCPSARASLSLTHYTLACSSQSERGALPLFHVWVGSFLLYMAYSTASPTCRMFYIWGHWNTSTAVTGTVVSTTDCWKVWKVLKIEWLIHVFFTH